MHLDCAEYFRSQAGYRRCFCELLKKWKSYGRPAGRIVLEHTSEEERRLLGGILGKKFSEETIRFSFEEFERGLQKTRFAPVDMKALLEGYFRTELSTNQEQKRKKQQDREEFFRKFYERFAEKKKDGAESAAALWSRQMAGTKSGGYYLLSREFSRDPEAAKTLAENVGKALTALSSAREGGRGNTALAVFAAEISGNPHYFDRGSTAGQLLTDALCCVMGRRQPENTHQWKELLLEAGIAPDYVSSFVHICGICLETE